MTKNSTVMVTIDPETFFHEHDVILTDYEALRRNGNVYIPVHWHRIVLDECQEVKVATNRIASLVRKKEKFDIVTCSYLIPIKFYYILA